MLYYLLFWTLLGFIIHVYIIFGTNLLTGGPAQNCCFCLFKGFEEKEYEKESKRNETFGRVIFGTDAIQETWSRRQGSNEEATRQGGAPPPLWLPYPLGRAPTLVAPLTDFFRLCISIYPKNIEEHNRSGVPPPQASVATKTSWEPVTAPCRRGNPSPVAIFIISALSMTGRE